MKMQDVKLTDQMTGYENAGHEITGHEITRRENARQFTATAYCVLQLHTDCHKHSTLNK
jgi:hypothetical protein